VRDLDVVVEISVLSFRAKREILCPGKALLRPEDINKTNVEPAPVPQNAGGIIGDSIRRIYRDNTNVGRNDGVEVVQFTKPGTYLVICARKNHFFDPDTQQFQMSGFVRVLP
jgi:hypothetical protein